MYAKVLLCLALPVVANAMGVVDVDRKSCEPPQGGFPTSAAWNNFATKDDCISFCQSESAAYGDNCRRTIVWKDDCGADGCVLFEFPGSNNCYCDYQTTCGCECYLCPVPDWMFDIDPQGGTYPTPDWDAIPPCPAHAGGPPAATC